MGSTYTIKAYKLQQSDTASKLKNYIQGKIGYFLKI